MAYLLRGVDDYGDPVDVPVEFCWRCGCMVGVMLVPMSEHVDRCHPPAAPVEPRHALNAARRPPA